MPKGKKGSKRVVLGEGICGFEWHTAGSRRGYAVHLLSRNCDKKYLFNEWLVEGKKVRLIAEVSDAQRG